MQRCVHCGAMRVCVFCHEELPLCREVLPLCLNLDSLDLRIFLTVENNVAKSRKSFNGKEKKTK